MRLVPDADLLTRFRECLGPGSRFICLHCIATQLGVTPEVLNDAVVTPTWAGYSFASAHCHQCGTKAYCAIPAGPASV